MDFRDLLDLWWENLGDKNRQQEILRQMSAITFQQWKQVYFRSKDCEEAEIERIAFGKMSELASSQEEKTIVLLASSETGVVA